MYYSELHGFLPCPKRPPPGLVAQNQFYFSSSFLVVSSPFRDNLLLFLKVEGLGKNWTEVQPEVRLKELGSEKGIITVRSKI
jgi:hypothetical protein